MDIVILGAAYLLVFIGQLLPVVMVACGVWFFFLCFGLAPVPGCLYCGGISDCCCLCGGIEGAEKRKRYYFGWIRKEKRKNHE